MHALIQIRRINDQFAQLPDIPEEAPEIDRAPGAFNGCGIQPWSRGPAGSNLPVYERDREEINFTTAPQWAPAQAEKWSEERYRK